MLNLSLLSYKVTCVTPDGKQLDLTDISTGLGFSEGSKELAAKIQLKIACVEVNGKSITELVKPFTPIFIFADMGDGFAEVVRGKVEKWKIIESNREFYLDIEAADEAADLRHSQDNFFFTDGHTSTAILEEILNKWSIPCSIEVKSVKLGKKVYRKKYLADMISDVLKDLKEKNGGEYFVRATAGKIEIVERGKNSTIWHFDADENLFKVTESFDSSKIVTRVKVVGKSKDEGKPAVEQTVDGKNADYGTRQIIYERPDKETLDEATKAAKKILDEQGDIKRKTSIECPDVPTLRKGDKIRVKSSSGEGYFFVDSIRHNCVDRKMNLELTEAKDANKSLLNQVFDTASDDGSGSSEPY